MFRDAIPDTAGPRRTYVGSWHLADLPKPPAHVSS